MTRKPPFTVKHAFRDQSVRIVGALAPYDHAFGVKIQFGVEISAAEARALAAELVAEANRVDAVAAEKAAAEARREKWREREVAAGRMIVRDAGDVFGGRRR